MLSRRLVIVVMILIGSLMSIAGILLTYYFNFSTYMGNLNVILRYLGFALSLVLLFIGFHLLIVGIISLRS